jgi:hypothetical protein
MTSNSPSRRRTASPLPRTVDRNASAEQRAVYSLRICYPHLFVRFCEILSLTSSDVSKPTSNPGGVDTCVCEILFLCLVDSKLQIVGLDV